MIDCNLKTNLPGQLTLETPHFQSFSCRWSDICELLKTPEPFLVKGVQFLSQGLIAGFCRSSPDECWSRVLKQVSPAKIPSKRIRTHYQEPIASGNRRNSLT